MNPMRAQGRAPAFGTEGFLAVRAERVALACSAEGPLLSVNAVARPPTLLACGLLFAMPT